MVRWLHAVARAVTLREIVGWAGLLLTTAGAAWIYPPAGLLVPGLVLLAFAIVWRTP